MVALSVSISAKRSPDLTLSPSFFSHLARLPFSIVGDSAGMRMLIGMASALLSCRFFCDFFRGFLGGVLLGLLPGRAQFCGQPLCPLAGDVLLVPPGFL